MSNKNYTVEGEMERAVCNRFITVKENESGCLEEIAFHNEDEFNFAFDVTDVLGDKFGDRPAMLYVAKDMSERFFTFGDIKRLSSQAANYFTDIGIKRGDRVMLVLKRHWQFWVSILALHKIGAIAVPATSQLRERDFEYRFELGEIAAVICTCEDETPQKIDAVQDKAPMLKIKVLVGEKRSGWHSFDDEVSDYSEDFPRTADAPCGNDPMFMFFTSGTTGYPKMVLHTYKYPLGHYITAKYWHNVREGELHFTVSDTGWGKALWGKIYGQWLCGASIFVYDFDRFNASEILPMFKKYNIVTFCAPPTVYRMLIKENFESYDLSSIQCATTAGEALNPEVFKKFKEATGLSIMEGFGQTETVLIIGTLRGMQPKAGSMGKPIPSYRIGLMNTDGEECAVGETGEIVIYDGDTEMCGLFCGYCGRDDLTAEAWYDGAYHTGDLATRDSDGYYSYVGRKDDIIKSSGYRIGPFEIENLIMELPFVTECAVSAEPDEIRGQIVKATIVLTKGTEPTEELKKEVQNYVKTKTAPYKYPRKVVFTEELPKTISGKVIRNEL